MSPFRRASLIATLLAVSLAGQAPATEKVFRFGVMAEEAQEPDRVLRAYGGFNALLGRRLAAHGIKIPEIVVAHDVVDLSQRLRAGTVDFVIETVFPSLTLRERSGVLEPTLVVVRRDQREYRSVFFTKQDEPILKLTDLRGRTLVLQALRSTSAFAMPRAELLGQGLRLLAADDPKHDPQAVRYVLAGAEVNQAVWVLHGQGAAGAFNDRDWQGLPEAIRGQLRVFHETRPLLRALLSLRVGLDPTVRAPVEHLLLGLHEDPEAREILAQATGITRFERLTARDRADLRRWEALLRVKPNP